MNLREGKNNPILAFLIFHLIKTHEFELWFCMGEASELNIHKKFMKIGMSHMKTLELCKCILLGGLRDYSARLHLCWPQSESNTR